jgi:hypothetical protein
MSGMGLALLTFSFAQIQFGEKARSGVTVAALIGCTFFSTYAFAVWPHMLSALIVMFALLMAVYAGASNLKAALLAGLAVGLGQSIRIDMIVFAPAIIVWLRVFSDDHSRRPALVFLGGLVFGLVVASALNFLKSGYVNPFTYQNSLDVNDPALYAGMGILAGIAATGVIVFDARSMVKRGADFARIHPAKIFCLVAFAAALFYEPVAALIKGYWVTLVDSQAYEFLDRQSGIERNDAGWLVFYGVNKKALLQSTPFAALMLVPLIRLLQGRATALEWLAWIVLGGISTLFSFNQLDSGLAFNARLFVPVLPLIVVLAVSGLSELMARSGVKVKYIAFVVVFAFVIGAMLRLESISNSAYSVPLDIYPQLGLAAVIIGMVIYVQFVGGVMANAAAAVVGAAAFGLSAAVGVDDAMRSQFVRNKLEIESATLASAAPADALYVTTRPMIFSGERWRDASFLYPGIAEDEVTIGAIGRFQAAGGCVIFYGQAAVEWAASAGLKPRVLAASGGLSEGILAFADDDRCAIGARRAEGSV